MMSLLSRPLIIGVLLALAPAITSAGGPAPSAAGSAVSASPYAFLSCGRHSAYEVQMISGAGPFGASNLPFNKQPLKPKLSYNFLNTGVAIPHLVLVIDSRGSFTPGNVTAAINTGQRRYRPLVRLIARSGSTFTWDFGPMPAGAEELIHITIHLKRQCCYMEFLRTYGNLDRSGRPDMESLVNGGSSGGGGSSSSSLSHAIHPIDGTKMLVVRRG